MLTRKWLVMILSVADKHTRTILSYHVWVGYAFFFPALSMHFSVTFIKLKQII